MVDVPDLQMLVGSISREEFLREYWMKRPFFSRANPGLLSAIEPVLGPLEFGSLVAKAGPPFRHFLNGGQGFGTAEQSRDLYRNHDATIYFNVLSGLERWKSVLAADTGRRKLIFSIFAARTTKGSGVGCHFDNNENITVQLTGRKRWRIAPNPAIEFPLFNWPMGRPDYFPYGDRSRLLHELPPDAQEFVLEPGSVLYVPRGTFHEVTMIDDVETLALNICFFPQMWGTFLARVLEKRLLAMSAFRESSHLLDSNLEGKLAQCITLLKQHLDTTPLQDIAAQLREELTLRDPSIDDS